MRRENFIVRMSTGLCDRGTDSDISQQFTVISSYVSGEIYQVP